MAVKDYYKILELEPQATLKDIRKNFRKLALRYHPDKNVGNHYAEAWYREIQEAYKTLSDTRLRESYLRERWLVKSQGKSLAATLAVTPGMILKQTQELLQQVKQMDHFRMSHKLLQQQVLLAITDEKVDVLLAFNDAGLSNRIIEIVYRVMDAMEFKFIHPVILQLKKLANGDKEQLQFIEHYNRRRKRNHLWERYQGFVYFLLALVICAGIYFLNRRGRY